MTLEAASSIAADKGRRLPGGVKGWRQGPQSPEGEKLKVQFEKIIFFSVINFNVIFFKPILLIHLLPTGRGCQTKKHSGKLTNFEIHNYL